MNATAPSSRSYRITPDRLVLLLLVTECVLWLSDRMGWWHKGYAVMIGLAIVGLFMLGSLAWFVAALILRWRFQFSLRALLLLVIAVAAPCSWLAVEMKRAARQREVVAAIEAIGGGATYDSQFVIDEDDERITLAGRLRSGPPGYIISDTPGSDLYSSVIGVGLQRSNITAGWLDNVRSLRDIRAMSLAETRISDFDLQCLQYWPKLEYLYLDYDEISDRGLEQLQGLRQLRGLSLVGTHITDTGLECIATLSQLHDLTISFTQVTDAGLEHLKGMTKLRALVLRGTKVTEDAVKKLQLALPKCEIER
jgi:hypothetical protein